MAAGDALRESEDRSNRGFDHKLRIDATDQRLIELLLKGYTNKMIALHSRSPLSTIQRRIRRIFERDYIVRKNEINHKKLGLRKVYLLVTLKGDFSQQIANKISVIQGVTFVSIVTGGIDILCICIFRSTSELFKIIERIRIIEGVDRVTSLEEISTVSKNEFSVMNQAATDIDLNDIDGITTNPKETIT